MKTSAGLGAVLILWLMSAGAADSLVVEATAHGSFEDVKQMLRLAIENHGLVVDHESNVGDMLERTGKDLGATERIYVRAQVLEFCSAAYSRRTMQADPRLLAFCPYGIGIYQLPGESDTVHLVYRRPWDGAGAAGAAALREVDRLLGAILEEAAQ
ncbi:MAG TPA: DUF302 domain-containing protein [Burkholderiales bacterium]|nr:DUF302 domain-containing protein [Burkholderiales bacterium]